MPHFLRRKSVLLGILLFFVWNFALAQNSESYFYENEFDVSVPLKDKWSMGIGIGNRGMLQERFNGDQIFGYQHEHIEINHFTNYGISNSVVVSLGLRYRFREIFDAAETDEFRIIEQIEIAPANSAIPLSHRIRLEQRFREHTIHRIRYDLGYSRSISEFFSIGAGTEAIYAVSSDLKPEAEQRFSIGLENNSFENVELGLSFEYRMENYFRDLAHEFFIMTGVSLSL